MCVVFQLKMRSEVESDARAKLENKCMRVNYTQHMQSVEILAIILAREMKIFVYHVRTLMMIDKFSWWVKLNLVLFDMVFLQLTTLGRSTQNIIYSKILMELNMRLLFFQESTSSELK